MKHSGLIRVRQHCGKHLDFTVRRIGTYQKRLNVQSLQVRMKAVIAKERAKKEADGSDKEKE